MSFSGGRTSGYMAKRLLAGTAPYIYDEIVVGFANTAWEDEGTLVFVDRCDRELGFGTVWIEADVNQEHGEGTGHRVVDFRTASRNCEPFEDVIKKYGIPNPNFRHCTRELKLNPMRSYLQSIGWETGTYDTAIGIRGDEIDRMSVNAEKNRIIYPLIEWKIKKPYIRSWWAKQPFDLEVPEHRGNCVTCWKKSDRKLLTLAKENPTDFDFFARMERLYYDAGPGDFDRPRRFFRKNRSAIDIIALAQQPFVPFVPDQELQFEMEWDESAGCEESCEMFSDYDLEHENAKKEYLEDR